MSNETSPLRFMDFQLLRNMFSASKLALLLLILLLLIPTQPFRGRAPHWIELTDVAEGRRGYELLKIYSVLKSHRIDLKEASAWAISETILAESIKHSIDPMLILAVIRVESRFQNAAISSKGARGLMQIRPFVANALAQEVDLGLDSESRKLDPESLYDPILNIKIGVFYLYYLKNSFSDLKLALTAYNWGPTEVKNRLERDEVVPFGYARKVLSTYHIYRRAGRQIQNLT